MATVTWDKKPVPIAWDDEVGKTDLPSPNKSRPPIAKTGKITWDDKTDKTPAVTSIVKGVTDYVFPDDPAKTPLGKLKALRETAGQGFTPERVAVMTDLAAGFAGNISPKVPVIGKLVSKQPAVAAKAPPKDLAGNINLERLGGADETRNVIAETAETQVPAMEAARRGTISHVETQELARTLGMTADDLLKRRKGQAFNAEEAFAARKTLMKSGSDLIILAKTARGGGDEALFAFKEALAKHQAVQEQVAGMTAEAGRALSQFNIRAGGALREDAIKRLLTGDRDRLADIADKMSVIDDPAKAAEFAARAAKATTFDKLYEVWINMLLSGPQTHVVNTLSNALVALWTIPETAIAGAYGSIARGSNRVFMRETTARMFGFVEGAKDGLRLAAKTLRTGEPQFESVTKIEVPRYRAIPGPVGEAIRIPGRLLATEDDFFKGLGYRMELNTLAMRDGLSKGLKGSDLAARIAEIKANPPEALQLKAIQAARYQTFSQELGGIGGKAQQAIAAAPVARVIMPFVRTPTNIMKFALERSPAAPALREVREALAKGGADRQQALARITLGSMVGAVVASLAAEGRITGGGPSDPGQKAALYATGWQPYSIKIGDTWYAYGRLEPLGMILGISADFGATADKMGQMEADEAAAAIAVSISKNLVSKTWLSGLSDLLSALEDPDQFAPSYLRRMAGTLIPTGVAQAERAINPTMQDARSVIDTLKSRVPGLSSDLPPKRNIFGEPLRYGGGVGPDILSPVYTSKDKNNQAAEEMVKLGVSASGPTRQIQSIDLTPEQYSEYVRMAGEGLQSDMEALIDSAGYRDLSNDAKVDALEKTIRRHREAARKQIVAKFPDLAKAIEERSGKAEKVREELKTLR